MSGFFNREPAKGEKLDDLRELRVDGFETGKRMIERQQRHVLRSREVLRIVDGHTLDTIVAFARAVTTGVIDEDASHRLRRDAEEVCPILPVHLTLIDQSQVDLMHQGRRLQRVVHAFAAKLAGGYAAELIVDERQQLLERGRVASTPVSQQRRDAPTRRHIRLQAKDRGIRCSAAMFQRAGDPIEPLFARSPLAREDQP